MTTSPGGAHRQALATFLAAGLLAGCGGATAPSSSPASRAPAVSPAGASASTAPLKVTADNWQQIVDAANKEGNVTVWGENGGPGRQFEKDAFEKAYPNIKVDLFQANNSAERDQRFMQEYKAGVAKVDVLISGSAGANATVKPQGMLQDIHPYLRPDILDPKSWRNGKVLWVDKEQRFMLQSDTVVNAVIVNKSVDVNELQNYEDLLNPKWKGKMIIIDGRESGGGFSEALFFYYSLGKDFFDKFYGSGGVVFSSDERKNLEWTDQGRMLIDINARTSVIEPLQKTGGTFKWLPPMKHTNKPLDKFSGSSGIMFLPNLNPLPHPNAAAVYANWFYSKAGQQSMIDILGEPSNRADIDQSKLPEYAVPKPGIEYINMNDEMFTDGARVKAMRDELSRVYVAPAQS